MIKKNLSQHELIEEIIKNHEAKFSKTGALVTKTGKFTGRAAQDKYIVDNATTRDSINWSEANKKITESQYKAIKKEIENYHKESAQLYIQESSAGHAKFESINLKLITTQSLHALFSTYMFNPYLKSIDELFTIYHAPGLNLNKTEHQLNSTAAVVINFDEKVVLIAGTYYAGEIKKSAFSILNFILPEKNILPMHSGVNIHKTTQDTSIFFGLSGTGKTTLATDEACLLIGDDEHGLSDKGVFNFEGGCYAKTFELKQEQEPDIFQASNRFGAILENVKIDEDTREVNFNDKTITENGRSSYPLKFIQNKNLEAFGAIPTNIFFLSADAFGVLPPVSKLDQEQANRFFKLGYTAKLAGTESGLTEPKATFSSCFGAPFMVRHSKVYAELLTNFIQKYNIQVWLINTGWYGGAYGTGKRFPIHTTRRIIRAIQTNELAKVEFEKDKIFSLAIPKKINEVEQKLLNPSDSWNSLEEYARAANHLQNLFLKEAK